MDTTDMTHEQLISANEKYSKMAEEYVKNNPLPPPSPELQAEYNRKEARMFKRNRQSDSEPSDNSTNSPTNKRPKANTSIWKKFFIIESAEKEGATLDKLSPFAVQKYVTALVSTDATVKKLRSGSLLVEAHTKQQSENVMKIHHFGQIKVKVSPHNSLNSKKGVVRSPDLKDMSEEDILRELEDQGVTHVKRIKFDKDGRKENSNILILTFGTHTLPKSITAGYLRLAVSQFYSNPLRCYKCQRFGHHKEKCRGVVTCQVCSAEGHDSRDCKETKKCRNCEGSHPSNSKECPAWQKEKQIVKIKTDEDISYPEARRRCEARAAAGPVTYAQAAAAAPLPHKPTAPSKTTKTIQTQTNITWPRNSATYSYLTRESGVQTTSTGNTHIKRQPPPKTIPPKTQIPTKESTKTRPPTKESTKTQPPNKESTKTNTTKKNRHSKAGPASSKIGHKQQLEIEIHNRFDSLSEKEEDDMDTSPCHNPEHSSSSEESE